MKITFHGAAGMVTGSKHLIELENGEKILLDCGLFQGMGKDTLTYNNNFGFNPAEVSYVFLSHAHIDHIGLLPKLVREGFRGKIYGTPATLDLATVLLKDSAYIQMADTRFVNKRRAKRNEGPIAPLYTMEDAEKVPDYFIPLAIGKTYKIENDIEVTLYDTGHIPGSCTTFLSIKENKTVKKIAYSGDVGRYNNTLLKSPENFPQADYVIIESTYGNRLHEKAEASSETLRDFIIETCREKHGKLIIPAFSVGRTQELLYMLNELELENRLPSLKYYVDSPLSTEATMIIKKHTECFNKSVQRILKFDNDPFAFKGLHYIEDKRESQSLNSSNEPCVIISASGMAEAGRVKHHIANNIENPRTTILIVGYCEKNSLGAKLKEKPEEVTIFGDKFKVNAEIRSIESMSAHADYIDLYQYLAVQYPSDLKKMFIVHGNPDAQQDFKNNLIRKGYKNVIIPNLHETFKI